ncbi:MAG: sulfotransferase [Anderseniella sp.]|jgi:hypothetical protein|nr:sulfotransferase [Anderseniella sp.]
MCGKLIPQDVFDGRLNDRGHAVAVFKAHADEVKAAIPRERLLVYETVSGWAPQCDFLGVAEPDEPYPLTNSTREFQERVAARQAGDQ